MQSGVAVREKWQIKYLISSFHPFIVEMIICCAYSRRICCLRILIAVACSDDIIFMKMRANCYHVSTGSCHNDLKISSKVFDSNRSLEDLSRVWPYTIRLTPKSDLSPMCFPVNDTKWLSRDFATTLPCDCNIPMWKDYQPVSRGLANFWLSVSCRSSITVCVWVSLIICDQWSIKKVQYALGSTKKHCQMYSETR
jgi:hypothetical protein